MKIWGRIQGGADSGLDVSDELVRWTKSSRESRLPCKQDGVDKGFGTRPSSERAAA